MNGPYQIYVRNSSRGREVPLMGMETDEALACERARALSWHVLPALRPFYVAVYDAVNTYPALYRNGEEMTGAAAQLAYTTPPGGAPDRSEPHGTGCACEDCPDYDGLSGAA